MSLRPRASAAAPRLLAAALCLLASLAPAPPAAAGTTLDLSPYLGQVRAPGEFKVYAWSTGGTRTVTTLAAEPWAKGWKFRVESRLAGTPDGDSVSTYESYLIPGKQLLSGSQHFEGFDFWHTKPAKGLRLLTTLGKPQRTKSKALLVVNGFLAGGVLRRGAWVAEGFESVTTPSGEHPNALRARAFSGLGIYDGFDEIVFVYDETLWYAEGFGLVKAQTRVETWENGALAEAQKWIESLASGSLGGVPFP
jgi:hypothetical protein